MSRDGDESHAVFFIGHHELQGRDYAITDEVLDYAQQDCNYDLLTAPITTEKFKQRVISATLAYMQRRDDEAPPPLLEPLNYPQDTQIAPSFSTSHLVFFTSSWIDLASPDPLIADISSQVLQLEVQYAAFCGATNIVVGHGPYMHQEAHCSPEAVSRYARAVRSALNGAPYVQISLLFDMGCPEGASVYKSNEHNLAQYAREDYSWNLTSGEDPSKDEYQSWEIWNTIRTVCKYNGRLSVALTFPQSLPSLSLQSRWHSEPLRILHLPSQVFLKDSQDNASLNQLHRHLFEKYMCLRNPPWILISGVGPLPGLKELELSSAPPPPPPPPLSMDHSSSSPPVFFSGNSQNPVEAASSTISSSSHFSTTQIFPLDYLRRLQFQFPPKLPMERFGAGYQDFLQNPLQPLSDNLESITYEVFEKDPIKYDWYERAMTYALRDWKANSKPTSGHKGRVVLVVLGAGRGPLVTRALQASNKAGVDLELWALEKNPNAFVLLQKMNKERWADQVCLANADMRYWDGPFHQAAGSSLKTKYKVDIVVSELLGSFADNELSPECLDGVQHLLNPVHGLSIPSSYSCYLTPIAAPKLHADIIAKVATGDYNAGETPYVCFLHSVDMLSARSPSKPPQATTGFHPQRFRTEPIPIIHPVWEFHHPSKASSSAQNQQLPDNRHNRRFKKLEFHCRDRGVCHGLAGYFETVLYDPAMHAGTAQAGSTKVELSTHPLSMDLKSKDMISWFPIYFPLKTPFYFPDNTLLSVSIWRQTDERKVWYEWIVESFMLLDTDELGHHKVERLGVTDLHSSVATACLL